MLVGETITDPLAGSVPMPWSIVTVVASSELQLRVVLWPALIVPGAAAIATVGASGWGLLIAVLTPPEHPAKVNMRISAAQIALSAASCFFDTRAHQLGAAC